ncbi:MAG: hypothetical protein ABR587_08390 [Candidatus Binatia bacterium]
MNSVHDSPPDASRPWWMTLLAALSGLTAVVSVIRDTVIPASRDVASGPLVG